jgi:hypothetical protein
VALSYRQRDPWANRESLPIHVHEEAVPPEYTPPAWVFAMGPKGYETDYGYLTRSHPPIRREIPREAGAPRYVEPARPAGQRPARPGTKR